MHGLECENAEVCTGRMGKLKKPAHETEKAPIGARILDARAALDSAALVELNSRFKALFVN